MVSRLPHSEDSRTACGCLWGGVGWPVRKAQATPGVGLASTHILPTGWVFPGHEMHPASRIHSANTDPLSYDVLTTLIPTGYELFLHFLTVEYLRFNSCSDLQRFSDLLRPNQAILQRFLDFATPALVR